MPTSGAALGGLLAARLFLAALFLMSGLAKIGISGWLVSVGVFDKNYGNAPREFATGMHKFKLLDLDLIADMAFVIPWIEIVCGVALLLGLATRGAAYLVNLLVAAFTAGILLVIARDLPVENCACFGGRLAENFGIVGKFLEPEVGWMSVVRNLVILALGMVIVKFGGGYFSIDRIFWKRRRHQRA